MPGGRPKLKRDHCPCDGKGNWSWHRKRGLPQCQASIDNGMIKENKVWAQGTSIYVPEFEEP